MKVNFKLHLTVWLYYPNGKKKKVIDRRSKSFVQAMIDTLSGQFRDSAHTFKDTGGTNRVTNLNNQINAIMGDVTHGIVVGNGYSDVLPGDYQLASIMANGGGINQLIYSLSTWTAIDTSDSTKRSLTIQRHMTNEYALPQIIRECGLYVKNGGTSTYFCFVRDLLGGIEIPPKGGVGICYKVEISL